MTIRHLGWACFAWLCLLIAPQSASAQSSAADQFAALPWQIGPTTGDLKGIASVVVPEGYKFLGPDGTRKFMELTENPTDGSEVGTLVRDGDSWFMIFSFSAQGYVKDEDRDDLDADALLSSITKGTEQSNALRRERGWSTLQILGWQQPPFYDSRTNNLTWSIRASSDGGTSINHSTRLLGRRGVMNADLVLAPEQVGDAVPAFNQLLTGYSFNTGQRYAEFRQGDKVADYGLAGLIVGGVGVTLVKTGLLQKFWKLLLIGLFAVAAGLKRLFGRFSRRPEEPKPSANV